MAVAVMALSRLLAMDDVLGVSTGHEETARFIENFLRRFEDGRAPLPPLAQRGETIDTDVSRN